MKSTILAESKFLRSAYGLNRILLFIVALQPNLVIWMRITRAWRREDGQSWWRLIALTRLATESNAVVLEVALWKKDEAKWPGWRTPSRVRSIQVVGRLWRLTPHSSFLLLG